MFFLYSLIKKTFASIFAVYSLFVNVLGQKNSRLTNIKRECTCLLLVRLSCFQDGACVLLRQSATSRSHGGHGVPLRASRGSRA